MKCLIVLCAAIFIVGVYSNDIDNFPIKVPNGVIDMCAKKKELNEAEVNEAIANKSFSSTPAIRYFGACLLENSGLIIDGGINEDFAKTAAGEECLKLVEEQSCKIKTSASIMSCLLQKGYVTMAE